MRRMKYLISIILLLGFVKSISQCPSQTLIFTTQDEIDHFIIDYPDCNRISGALIIDESEVSNLAGLANLTYVGADVMIENNDNLINFDGLENLDSIGQSLIIRNNQNLENIDALAGLSYVNKNIRYIGFDKITTLNGFMGLDYIRGDLIIGFHDELIDIMGLSNIDSIDGQLKLQRNNKLTNVLGLSSLKKIKGDISQISGDNILSLNGLNSLESTGALWVEFLPRVKNLNGLKNWRSAKGFTSRVSNMDSLITLEGLDNLTFIDGDLSFAFNPMLKDLDGIESLRSISHDLILVNMDSLQQVDALINLEKVGGDILIANAFQLQNLKGLKNIDPSEIDLVEIFDNPLLETCAVRSICDYLEAGGPHEIFNNKEGCQDAATILEICETVSNDDIEYNAIDIYPNPVIDHLYIDDLSDEANIEIYSIDGKLVKSVINPRYSIDLSEVESGMYILILRDKGKLGMQKFTKSP